MFGSKFCKLAMTTAFVLSSAISLSAQGLIRDAEIERTLKLAAKPILAKAGVSQSNANILVVNDRSLNAFVAGGRHIFVHHGLILKLKSVEQLQSVLAHEVGHITGGHIAQRAGAAASSKTAAGVGFLLGIAAAAAGSGEAAVALSAGSASVATRNFLTHTRAQESSADQSGARFMAAAGIDPVAAIEVLEIFDGQDLMSAKHRDPYTLSHPMSRERIANLRAFAGAYKPRASTQPANLDYWYARMVAKFNGFTNNPASVLRRVKKSDKGEIATLTRAIAYHRKPDRKRAINEINRLVNMRPNDAYYHELRGQILLENRDVNGAIKSYRTATKLAPNESLILAGLGRSLNAANTNNKEALNVLQRAYSKDPRDGRMLRELAVAYARAGQNGNASVVTAERYALASNFKQASVHAKRAQGLLPQGTSGWLKAQEILALAKQATSRKR
ncbi:peptidase M48 [Amylibacter ulvae]|uniref:Peptidase M48 n=1 Tax=Paramylibacter ulvae TaxID=1651968 RepID=A0ABQ3CRZ2_9RHOB|nr:M48 family metalloprotease [Amylibacter ulvae]GHA41231.1 peptidase M48 [Amylibacter ulvae]